jgi:hypothetical protein
MDNNMDNIESLKFDFIEDNVYAMLEPLQNDQTFLRYVLNLNDFPLFQSYMNEDGVLINQPDYELPYNLFSNQTVLLSLFNERILKDSKIYIFFSPLRGTCKEGDPIMSNKYVMSIIIPSNKMIIENSGKLRMFRIANQVCKAWDNQYITGMGRVIMYDWNTGVVNSEYQGIDLYFKIDDNAYTD